MRRALVLAAAALALLGAAPPNLPAIHATTVSGTEFDAKPADHHVVVVHYWATWCAPCKIEMPLLDAAYRRHHAQGVDMIGVALDIGASRAKIAKHAMGVTFPLARADDTNLPRGSLPSVLPETLIYGRDGRLLYRFHGQPPLDAAGLEQALTVALVKP